MKAGGPGWPISIKRHQASGNAETCSFYISEIHKSAFLH